MVQSEFHWSLLPSPLRNADRAQLYPRDSTMRRIATPSLPSQLLSQATRRIDLRHIVNQALHCYGAKCVRFHAQTRS